MKKFTVLVTMFLFLSIVAAAQSFNLKGKITSLGAPVPGCTVFNQQSGITVVTNDKGEYSLEAKKGDKIIFNYVGHESIMKIVTTSDNLDVDFVFSAPNQNDVTVSFTSSSVSIKNFWVGAKLGYNFIGDADDDYFVGAATIALNLLDNNDRHHTFGIIGNIGNFKFNGDSSDTKNIQKLAQSINGLSVGVGYTHETYIRGKNKYKSDQYPTSYFRKFILTSARLTTFSKVGPDSVTVNLGQSVTTGGFEFEQTGFKNGGSITASVGLSLYLFDKGLYKKVFQKERSKLFTVDMTCILPISKNMGFFVNTTFAKHSSPAYILGVVFKP